jgi:hypothetical protein
MIFWMGLNRGMTMSRKSSAALSGQSRRFLDKARELGCDEDPKAFDRVFARVVPPKRRPETPGKDGVRKKRRLTSRKQGTSSDG